MKTSCQRCGAEFVPAAATAQTCPRCLLQLGLEPGEAVAPLSDALLPGPTLDELRPHFPDLEILERVGQGGMGTVYRARQRELDRPVALKVLHSSGAADPTFAERFAREARALASLDHPNVVRIYASGRAGPHYYLLMEFVEGAHLRSLMRGRQLGAAQALGVVAQICDALQYAHGQGVIHRDIKPENILVDPRGRVKIADFGLAKMFGGGVDCFTLTRSDQAMGTPHYMAPEQVERPLEVDHRADIYSLGVVFYELLTGELPLGRFLKPSQKAGVDVRLDEVVLKSLAREPQSRYQAAGDLRTDVEAITGSTATPEHAASSSAESAGGRGSQLEVGKKVGLASAVGGGCVVALLMLVGTFAVLLGGRSGRDYLDERPSGPPLVLTRSSLVAPEHWTVLLAEEAERYGVDAATVARLDAVCAPLLAEYRAAVLAGSSRAKRLERGVEVTVEAFARERQRILRDLKQAVRSVIGMRHDIEARLRLDQLLDLGQERESIRMRLDEPRGYQVERGRSTAWVLRLNPVLLGLWERWAPEGLPGLRPDPAPAQNAGD